MSIPSQTPASSSHLGSILDVALNEYKKNTGKDLLSHPLADQLQRCDSADDILAILRSQANKFEQQLRDGDRGLMKWINSSVHILCPISATLGEGVGLAFPPAKPIFIGIGVLLAAAKDVTASHKMLLDLLERMEAFFKRFNVYTKSYPSAELAGALVEVVEKVLKILSIATKEIEKSRTKRYFRILLGKNTIEDALGELEYLSQGVHYTETTQVLQDTSQLKHGMGVVGAAVQQMVNKKTEEERKNIRKDTREWFSPPNPSINHVTLWKDCHLGSATWLFGRDVFIDWMSTGSLLWVHGKPGSGKSILCSAIIQCIITDLCEAGQASMVYFYFDFRDKEKQNARNLVTSLLIQLSTFSDPCCDIIGRVYSAHGSGLRQPTNDVLMNCLKEMLTVVAEHPIYIVMDAVDECPDHSGLPTARKEVLDVLNDLVGLHLPNLRVCVTSRPEVDIKSVLNQLAIHTISLHDETEQRQGIADYVSSVVNSDWKMREWPDEDKELVIKVLSERADGMFRWVYCQLETLQRSVQRNLREILQKLPKTLDETYERILKDIHEVNTEHARRLLHCLAFSIRPLRVEELAEILAFEFDDDTQGGIPKFHPGWRRKDHEEAVLSTCSSLIAVVEVHDDDGYHRVVQFSHFSVKEFLLSDRLASSTGDVSRYHILPVHAHTILAQACLGSLLQSDDRIDEESDGDASPLARYGDTSPLARYAAKHWVTHAQFEDVAARVKDGMRSLFDPDKRHLAAWIRIKNIDPLSHGPPPDVPNPLYYSALCGFHDLVEHLVINHPQLVNAIHDRSEFPLLAALSGEHTSIAEFLLRHGAKVEIRNTMGKTLLHVAVSNGLTVDAVHFLLEREADVNSQTDYRWFPLKTPLHIATISGFYKLAQVLLVHGADIDSRDNEGQTSLHALLKHHSGHPDIARLLLEHGANVNAQDKYHRTPLHLEMKWRRESERVQILLDFGADVNAKNNNCETPLHSLLQLESRSELKDFQFFHNDSYLILARLLLDRGANVNAQDKDHTTPLHLATSWGWGGEMVQILLERGAELNVKNNDCKTPLHLLLEDSTISPGVDYLDLVRLLLKHGADVNAQDKDHTTPLHLAIQRRSYKVARILLEHGAEQIVTSNDGKTPLHLVLERGKYYRSNYRGGTQPDAEIHTSSGARLLLEHGANVNALDKDHTTSLLLAIQLKMYDITRILLARGADPNVKTGNGKAPLHILLEGGFAYKDDIPGLTRLFLERGAEPNVKNNKGKTPLHLLLERNLHDADDVNGVLVVERLLLKRGADVNAQDENNTTPLHLALNHRWFEIAQIILDHANVGKDRRRAQFHITSKERDADMNVPNMDHATDLHSACEFGRLQMARELLNRGANASAENIQGETPLHLVSRGQDDTQEDGVGIVQLLLGCKANINAQDNGRTTPLHLACFHGRLEIARVLLQHGAIVNENDLGQTPLHYVLKGSSGDRDGVNIVRLLLEHGADVNAQDGYNETPLHLAARYGKLGIGRVLLIHGANPNAENILAQTLLDVLSLRPPRSGDVEQFADILADGGADIHAPDMDDDTSFLPRLVRRNSMLDWDL